MVLSASNHFSVRMLLISVKFSTVFQSLVAVAVARYDSASIVSYS